ncbi:hypothetical protein B0H11DRAFT_1931279 [Mycena galericulata]|nr:hypothetical protein B0H11DRAFT_1931279 [Mycena galericulata]
MYKEGVSIDSSDKGKWMGSNLKPRTFSTVQCKNRQMGGIPISKTGYLGYLHFYVGLVSSACDLTTICIGVLALNLAGILLVSLFCDRARSKLLSEQQKSKQLQDMCITIMGPFSTPVDLDVAPHERISDILQRLRSKGHIADPDTVKHYVVFPRHGFASLEPADILCDLGISDQSVLHVRTSVLGGAPSSCAAKPNETASSSKSPFLGDNSATSSSFVLQRITNSPLVESLYWSIDGLDNEDWRNWPNNPPNGLEIPPHIHFAKLLDDINKVTNDNLSASGTAIQRFTRYFCGFDATLEVANSSQRLPPNNAILALHVLQLFATTLGVSRNVPSKEYPKLDLPELKGKNLDVLRKLDNWPSVITSAHDSSIRHSFGSETGTVQNLSGSPQDPQKRLLNALYNNFSSSFKKNKFHQILINVQLAAFMLGWYMQLSELITPFILLLPVPLVTWSFNDVQLIQIRRYLGKKPPAVIAYEEAFLQELWKVAEGLETPERALWAFFSNLENLPSTEGTEGWFYQAPKKPAAAAASNCSPSNSGLAISLHATTSNSQSESVGTRKDDVLFPQWVHGSPQAPNSTELPTMASSKPLEQNDSSRNQLTDIINAQGTGNINSEKNRCHRPLPEKSLEKRSEPATDNTAWAQQLAAAINSASAMGTSEIDSETTDGPLLSTLQSGAFRPWDHSNRYRAIAVSIPSSANPDHHLPSGPTIDPALLNPNIPAYPRNDTILPDLSNQLYPSSLGLDIPVGLSDAAFGSSDAVDGTLGLANPGKHPRVDDSSDLTSLSSDDQSPPDPKPRKRKPRKLRPKQKQKKAKLEAPLEDKAEISDADSDGPESEDSDVQYIPFIDLTGDDDLWSSRVVNFNKQEKVARDPVGIHVQCYSTKNRIVNFHFRAFMKECKHPWMNRKEYSKDNEYRIAQEIHSSFEKGFVQVPGLSPSPKYWLDSAGIPEYMKGCSIFFVATKEQWLTLDGYTRQEIFKNRHIVIRGLMSTMDFNMDAFDLMGIPLDRLVEMHDLSLRTPQDQMGGMIVGTPQTFLHESLEGRVLNVMDLPMHYTTLPDPEGFQDLDTSGAALARTRTLSGCQYYGALPVESHTKWGMATSSGATTLVHADRMATQVTVKTGSKMWYCATGNMETVHALDNWDPLMSCTQDHSFEGTLLEAGDVFCWAHIHTSILDQALTNAGHEDASIFFIQMQAWWFVNFKLIQMGQDLGSFTKIHIPDIGSWKGFLQMLCVSNLVVFLEALDYRNYLDIRPGSLDRLSSTQIEAEKVRRGTSNSQCRLAFQTFEAFRVWFSKHYWVKLGSEVIDINRDIFHKSVVHLAVILSFYKSEDHGIKVNTPRWTTTAFQKKLSQALEEYQRNDSGKSLILSYNKLTQDMLQGERKLAGNGHFLPDGWTDDTFEVIRKI